MTITAITSPANEAKSDLAKYQQKLAADLAAKAAAKVISADKNAVAQAQLEIKQAQQAQQMLETEKTQQARVAEAKDTTGTGTSGLTKSASAVSGSLDTTM